MKDKNNISSTSVTRSRVKVQTEYELIVLVGWVTQNEEYLLTVDTFVVVFLIYIITFLWKAMFVHFTDMRTHPFTF